MFSSVLVRYSAKYNHVLLFKLFFGFINIQSKKKKKKFSGGKKYDFKSLNNLFYIMFVHLSKGIT